MWLLRGVVMERVVASCEAKPKLSAEPRLLGLESWGLECLAAEFDLYLESQCNFKFAPRCLGETFSIFFSHLLE